MARVGKIGQRTLIGVFALGSILLVFSGLNPFSETSILIRLLMLFIALLLALGLLPNSYLRRFVEGSLERPPERGSGLLVLVSTLGPLFIVVLAVSAILANVDTLRLIDKLGVEFADPRSAIYNMVMYAIFGLVSLILFVWNVLDLIRGRGTAQVA